MNAIETWHSAWSTTFPHRVVPQAEEWFPGLLLRCDLANHWTSKTAMALITHGRPRAALTATPTLAVVPLWMSAVLAECLALPLEGLLATTYHRELMRLYAPLVPHWKQLNATCVFRVCPECVTQDHLLTRLLVLPHIHACPQHHVALLRVCQCGHALSAFSRGTQPFLCKHCGLEWAKLARLPASDEQMRKEQEVLTWFAFFLTEGTPELLARALHLVRSTMRKRKMTSVLSLDGTMRYVERHHVQSISLGYVVDLLMSLGLAPDDVRGYDGPLPWWSRQFSSLGASAILPMEQERD